jgi:arabinofuranan 3-O-arabinosyltransferase
LSAPSQVRSTQRVEVSIPTEAVAIDAKKAAPSVREKGPPLVDESGDRPLSRRVLAVFSAGIAGLCILQESGRIVADTKLDVAIAPIPFLSHALSLWSSQQQFGGVPFQAYGYLFPMGPFFVVGHLLQLPTWVIQRLWVAALLVTAFWGIVRLAEVLRVGSRVSRILAALAFVFMPPISLLGATSSFVLAFSLLPWVLIPLVQGSREGSTRRAACRSGIAILLMGGINASATLAVLPLPLLWFLTRTPGARRRQLASWWLLALFLACAWWAISLLFEARYGFNLLPYTESASVTTSTTPLFDVLRGNSYWVAYDQIGPTAIRSGLEAVTSPAMIVAGGAVTALGLFGLAHTKMKERTWLVGALATGVVLVGAGYPGTLGAPFSSFVQGLLGGSLALFRNVWKFQPVINLVLVLGLAHAVEVLVGEPRRRHVHSVSSSSRLAVAKNGVIVLTSVCVALLSLPFLTDSFFSPGSFASVPGYWQATASWLDHHAGTTTSLVVPGSSVGVYTWGSPQDEPLQWTSRSNWAVRGLIPDSSVGNIETLDAVEQVLAANGPNPALATFLAQSGVRYLIERNDLSPKSGAPGPLQVHLNLSTTPGLTRVSTFGPNRTYQYRGVSASLPAVEIYEVKGPARTVITAPVKNSIVVAGDSQALLTLDQDGLDPGDRAVFLAGDGGVPSGGQTPVVTDSSPRIGVTFGATRYNETYVLTKDQKSPTTGQPPVGWTVVSGSQNQTVAEFVGVKNVTASSFGSNALFESPINQPAAAFDGDPETSWVANGTDNSMGQWIQVAFDAPRRVSHITLQLTAAPRIPKVTKVSVSTAGGSLVQSVRLGSSSQVLRVPPGRTSWLRLTFSRVAPAVRPSLIPTGAGVQELTIPGVRIQKAEVTPPSPLSAGAGSRSPLYVFMSLSPGATYGVTFGGVDEEPQMVRVFTTPRSEQLDLQGTIMPRPGPALAQLLHFLGPAALTVRPLHLGCGDGPTVTVDGTPLKTEVNGTFGGFKGFHQLQFTACGPSTPLKLAAGAHVLKGNVGGYFKVTSVALTPVGTAPYGASPPPRTVTVKSWKNDRRAVVVGPGGPSYLIVRQNYNSGWTARLGGSVLTPARVNGWQQAWVLPAGSGGMVTLSYSPDTAFRLGLLIGGALVLALFAIALWPSRRRNAAEPLQPREAPAGVVLVVAALALYVVGGILAVGLIGLIFVAWAIRSAAWLPVVAGLSYFGASVAVAREVGRYPTSAVGAFGIPAQVASALALAAVFASVVVSSSWWQRMRSRRQRDKDLLMHGFDEH